MRLTIDTETDTYEQAIAAVQAAYGLRPAAPADWPDAPAVEPRTGPQDLADDDLADGWSDQLLFQVLADLMPGARAVLRRITDLGGTASYDDVQQHFAHHPTVPIPPSRIGGTLTSIKAVQRRIGPDEAGPRSNGTSEHAATASTTPSWPLSPGPSPWPMPDPTSCAVTNRHHSPDAAAPPVEKRLARPRSELDRHAGQEGADVDRLPGAQRREALARAVRPECARCLEPAEQQHVVQLSIQLDVPLQGDLGSWRWRSDG